MAMTAASSGGTTRRPLPLRQRHPTSPSAACRRCAASSLDLRAGEVHGLVGANGAGKSTLIRILAGLERPDAGAIVIDGQPVAIDNPHAGDALGLGFIHQELALVPRMNVLENIMLGAPKRPASAWSTGARRRARWSRSPRRVGITFPLDAPISDLSTAERWLVSICRALVRQSRLIVMDEPTASLSVHEVGAAVRDRPRALAVRRRRALRLAPPRRDLDLCHRVTVFRDGRSGDAGCRASGLTRRGLVEAIVGGARPEALPPLQAARDARGACCGSRDVRRAPARPRRQPRSPSRRGARPRRTRRRRAQRAGAHRLRRRSGRRAATMTMTAAPIAPRSPAAAMKAGVGLVPEERRSEGLILLKSIAFNFGLANLDKLTRRAGRAAHQHAPPRPASPRTMIAQLQRARRPTSTRRSAGSRAATSRRS